MWNKYTSRRREKSWRGKLEQVWAKESTAFPWCSYCSAAAAKLKFVLATTVRWFPFLLRPLAHSLWAKSPQEKTYNRIWLTQTCITQLLGNWIFYLCFFFPWAKSQRKKKDNKKTKKIKIDCCLAVLQNRQQILNLT